MQIQPILEYFQKRQSEIINSILTLVETESPSLDEEGSRAAVEVILKKTETLRCVTKIERIYRAGYGEHLIIRAFENALTKPILLLGHLDTVYPRGSFRQNPTRIEGDKFYGCGVFDMKSNCILMLEILRAFDEMNYAPQRPINILLSCDEEVGSDTGRELVEREAQNAAFALVCEPSANGNVKTGRKGTAWFNLKAQGIPAHAGLEPEKGASAILELAKQAQKLHSFNDYEIGTTVNVCTIKGGTTSNVIPEFCEAEIDVRFSSLAEAQKIVREIESLQPVDERVVLTLEGGLNRPPLERTAQVVTLYQKAKQLADAMNYELGETQVGGASDGNFVGALGVPVLDGLGIKGDGAHTHHEHILISDIPHRAALISALLLAL